MNAPFTYASPTLSVEALKHSIAYKLMFTIGKDPVIANKHEWLNATLFAVRDRLVERWLRSNRAQLSQETRQVYYLSMEFLIGRTLSNALLSLGIYDDVKNALEGMGLDLEDLIDEENDPGLGNGGLGRLAACFLDSLATLGLPGRGYGIRYDYGMFKQNIVDGRQKESPDYWLEYGNPWEFKRHNTRYKVRFGGRIQQEGKKTRWIETEEILAVAYDQIIPGYDTDATNTLRLWNAQASSEINLGKFNQGDYFAAVEDKNHSENVSRVLYPDDSTYSGRELRLRQEYFLVSSTVQDILNRHYQLHKTYDNLADKIAIHLNDTHPVLSIPELMRLLIDEHKFSWDDAFEVCCQVFSYTNHTLMSEALETWSVDLMGRLLPRHLDIIFEINEHFLDALRAMGHTDDALIRRVSIIDEENGRRVRMAWLAVVGSHKINGVAKIHSNLMKTSIFADFAKIFPNRFTNVTNGVTPRRWIAVANRPLTQFLDKHLGEQDWRLHLDHLSKLNALVDNTEVQEEFAAVKQANKQRLADYVAKELGIKINPEALFDVQIKRIHGYKRQALNVMHIVDRYNKILENPYADWQPRVFILAGKAASAYHVAKKIIRLINDVAKVINNDERVRDLIKVVFIPNYSVSLAQIIIPAADLSEQISLAGTEASGTGNMKFALNGALTIGTLDGANVEILEHVGDEHIFIFGNTVEQVETLRREGYDLFSYIEQDNDLRRVVKQVVTGTFSPDEPNRYSDVLQAYGDHYQLMVDFRSYVDAQARADEHYRNRSAWLKSALINIANMGYFSSDRSIQDYADNIWYINPLSETELPVESA